jgi:16S rRNA (guanine527-N7)-methyltransferase
LSTIRDLGPEISARLAAYAELVRAWAPRLDLVAPGDLDRFEARHIEDSLEALPLVAAEAAGPAVDVGSGVGAPGVPLAIAAPDRHWRLLEPRHLRAAFLEEVVRELVLDAEVTALSAAQAAADPAVAGSHQIATARALSAPAQAEALCRPLVRAGGLVLVWRGKTARISSSSGALAQGLASIRVDGGNYGDQ